MILFVFFDYIYYNKSSVWAIYNVMDYDIKEAIYYSGLPYKSGGI